MQAALFSYTYRYAQSTAKGISQSVNQDEVICCPEFGFFAVSDGIGGLYGGGATSKLIAERFPRMLEEAYLNAGETLSPIRAAKILHNLVLRLSDSVFEEFNRHRALTYGATLCGVWLVDKYAVFINLGDSRGYLLERYQHRIRQMTKDHNIAAILIDEGELSKEEARRHPASSALTRFVGITPTLPDTFIAEIGSGDVLLLCTDGLHGVVDDERFPKLLRSGKNVPMVLDRLHDEAMRAGGLDDISALYIKIDRLAARKEV